MTLQMIVHLLEMSVLSPFYCVCCGMGYVFTAPQGFIFTYHHSSFAHMGQNFLLFKGTELRFKGVELLSKDPQLVVCLGL